MLLAVVVSLRILKQTLTLPAVTHSCTLRQLQTLELAPQASQLSMREVRLAYETSWQQNKNNCITAPGCLGQNWLPLLAPSSSVTMHTMQETSDLDIPDFQNLHMAGSPGSFCPSLSDRTDMYKYSVLNLAA